MPCAVGVGQTAHPMSTLQRVIAEVRATALSAVGVAPVARPDGQALYALSDAALLEALGRGEGAPREGPAESHAVAVPSRASDQPPSALTHSRAAMQIADDPVPAPGRPPTPNLHEGPKRDPNENAAGCPPPAHFGSNLTSAPSELHDPDPWT